MIFALFARRKDATRRAFASPDGVEWGIEVRSPSASNAMVVFHHPDTTTQRYNRYAWWVSDGAESRDVTARLDPAKILAQLTDDDVRALFRKSMPIDSRVPRFHPA